jgi:NAD(P)H-dependent flavin oxidoreductase YrpB (nitropropane dioxygenase family)
VVQGAEGGGHTGSVPTSLLIPSVVAATDLPVIAAGGFYNGRGLAAALAYGAAGIGMGTRFLLTSDSSVPDAVKQKYLSAGLDGTVVTTKADGVPHRLLRTDFTEQLDESGSVGRAIGSIRRALEFRKLSGMSWPAYLRDGLSMKRESGLTLAQVAQAANTPILLKAGLVEGDTSAGMLASGQVVGLIDELLSCQELVEQTVREAAAYLTAAAASVISTEELAVPDRSGVGDSR